MEKETFVYIDLNGVSSLVGRLWAHVRNNNESATFEYDASWLNHPARFSLEPALTLGPGSFHTQNALPMFGAIGDSAPDRWGRALMRSRERRRAEREHQYPRTLHEIDFLLLVDDEARQGALRFAEHEGGPFVRQDEAGRIPPFLELPRLLTAAEHVLEKKETDEDLRVLFAPGSSIGGARPKASVKDSDGQLYISKFPRRDDEVNTIAWEAVALTLAKKAGINVAVWRIETINNKSVLLLRRFDRNGAVRIPFLSAMSLLGSKDNETRSYLELVDALRQHGADPKSDMTRLWRRMVFTILISNTDDHMRNHGFLYDGSKGWRLSPAYDLNPIPTDIKPRILSTAIDESDCTASLTLAMEVAGYFGLDQKSGNKIASEVGKAVSTWRDEAANLGVEENEIDRMASAFEHEDLDLALRS